MQGDDVTSLLRSLYRAGVEAILEGGWGVDALVGHQLRPHKDVDVVVQLEDVAAMLTLLRAEGFRAVAGTPPHGFVCKDLSGRAVDVRGVTVAPDGRAIFSRGTDAEWIYTSDAFDGRGRIDDTEVRCLTASAQMVAHTGYEYSDKDIVEVWTLHDTFGVAVPDEYAGTKPPDT
jgi:lincosamide nucleotidyltransferase A/C/D/E